MSIKDAITKALGLPPDASGEVIVKTALGLPANASDEVTATALRQSLEQARPWNELLAEAEGELARTRALAESLATGHQAREDFTDLVDSLVKSEKLSYGDAARRISIERPDLYAEARAKAML